MSDLIEDPKEQPISEQQSDLKDEVMIDNVYVKGTLSNEGNTFTDENGKEFQLQDGIWKQPTPVAGGRKRRSLRKLGNSMRKMSRKMKKMMRWGGKKAGRKSRKAGRKSRSSRK
jgi:hypothetical protein